ncbi:hypothetical protein [Flavivirga algicola]|uniref:Uncharacterized protein n=1 Tax=Flavivirga algicola TaxID=2729136 RepID=A0ABX1S0R2_9FLAO|nr:hypothetical protein [Flavivirga algicola]NMH88458.1 hypothetical protein [Flavivirga algicola]
MSKTKIILILITATILFYLADSSFLKNEYHRGIIIGKKYVDKITYSGNNRSGHNIVFPVNEYDPNGFLFFIKDKSDDEIIIRGNYDTYKTSYEGDSIKYRLSKGFFTNRIWNSAIVEIIPNTRSRKQSSDKNLTPLEKLFRTKK